MTQHPSLSRGAKAKQQRSVLKRFQRIKILKAKDKWKKGDSVFGLLKVKTIKIKVKKEKAAEAPVVAPSGTEQTIAKEETSKEKGKT